MKVNRKALLAASRAAYNWPKGDDGALPFTETGLRLEVERELTLADKMKYG